MEKGQDKDFLKVDQSAEAPPNLDGLDSDDSDVGSKVDLTQVEMKEEERHMVLIR